MTSITHLRPIPCDLTTAQSVYLSAWLLSLPRQSSEVTCSQPFPVIRASLSGIALTFYLSLKCPLFREQKSKHTQSVCNSFPVTMTLPKYGLLLYWYTFIHMASITTFLYICIMDSDHRHATILSCLPPTPVDPCCLPICPVYFFLWPNDTFITVASWSVV